MSRNSNSGGVIAIIITIIVTGGVIFLALSNNTNANPGGSSSAAANPADHHGGTSSGPISDLNTLIGKPAPDFTLSDHGGQSYALKDLRGKTVVLFFNEGLMCYPACWNQIAALGDDQRFSGDDVIALSIVTDNPGEWDKAIRQMPELAKATIVHDTNSKVSRSYGVLTTASSMHYGQFPGHSYVVIDKDGVVRHVYDDPNMAIHNDQLIEEITKLS
ncbi:MAG: redoxin domain-containing protein [Candidatus Kerfeldbacteria bacterium]|nr:redoxin domain-containing protein [Candidatus Kerfeldbacteria bacterium]